jgi:hypothetical protein
MKNKSTLALISIIGSAVCWKTIDFFIVEISIWKYLIIETLIIITNMLYEKEKKRLAEKSNLT